jgi:hypothetical protein
LQDPLKVRISIYWQCSFGANEDRRGRAFKTVLLSEVQACLAALPPDQLRFTLERPAPTFGLRLSGGERDGDGGGGGGDDDGSAEGEGAAVARWRPAARARVGTRAGAGGGGGALASLRGAAGTVGAGWPGAAAAGLGAGGGGGGAAAAPAAFRPGASAHVVLPGMKH